MNRESPQGESYVHQDSLLSGSDTLDPLRVSHGHFKALLLGRSPGDSEFSLLYLAIVNVKNKRTRTLLQESQSQQSR